MSIFSTDKPSTQSGHINVIAIIKAKQNHESDVKAMLEALVIPSRAEDGCKAYHLHVDKKNPAAFYTYEEWISEEKLNTHLAGAKPLLEKAQPLLDGDLQIIVLDHLV